MHFYWRFDKEKPMGRTLSMSDVEAEEQYYAACDNFIDEVHQINLNAVLSGEPLSILVFNQGLYGIEPNWNELKAIAKEKGNVKVLEKLQRLQDLLLKHKRH